MIAIVNVDHKWGIGKDGDQLVYIPQDLKRFKEFTSGKTVIYGRKTMATFPNGKPLKNRRNLILSRNPNYTVEGGEVFSSKEELLENIVDSDDIFVIGGASVYNDFINVCDKAYVTKIDKEYSADCWFPNLDDDPNWEIESEEDWLEQDGVKFRYVNYRRK